jgi:methionyl-tRNA formyltransferase
VFCPEKASDLEFLQKLENMKPDLCITAAYGNYLPKRFLSIPKFGTVNIHPSLLPLYRGASPLQRCLGKLFQNFLYTLYLFMKQFPSISNILK